MKFIMSNTAVSHGYGTQPYKWTSGLTREEKRAVKNGEIVVYLDDRLSGGNYGTYIRRVFYQRGRGFSRAVAGPDLITAVEAVFGPCGYTPMTREERNRQAAWLRKKRVEKKRKNDAILKARFAQIHESAAFSPAELAAMGKISSRALQSFGINDAERAELANEKSCRIFQGRVVVRQGAIYRRGGYPELAAEEIGTFNGLFTFGYWYL